MADLNGFDAEKVQPTTDFEVMPKDDYLAIMVDSEMKDTRSGTGQYLQCAWEIVQDNFKGRRLWSRLNLKNTNEVAVKIAQAELSSICHAVGILHPKDSAELHNKPVMLKVAIEERSDRPGEKTNVIKGYAAPGTKPAAATSAATPPWKR